LLAAAAVTDLPASDRVPAPLADHGARAGPLGLSVVIVNHNGQRWLADCLHTLAGQLAGLAAEVIVVDNASQDGSADLIPALYPAARVVRNRSNVGFARANNQGFDLARGAYVLLLNTDTRFHAGLAQMLELLAAHPRIGAVGPLMLDQHGQPRDSWGHFPSLAALAFTMLLLDRVPGLRRLGAPLVVHPRHPEFARALHGPQRVDWLCGACLLTPRAVLEQVGPLDEAFFMYSEDVDWCYRARQAGYELWVTPAATLTHFGAGGREWNAWKGEAATVNAYAGFLTFHRKHSPAWRQFLVRLILATGALLRLAIGLGLAATRRGEGRGQAWRVVRAYAQALRLVLAVPVWQRSSHGRP
jgi:hypothetical protein